MLAEAIEAAPEPATPLEAVAAALDALTATFAEDRREMGGGCGRSSTKSAELQERAAFKRSVLTEAVIGALHERGVRGALGEPGRGPRGSGVPRGLRRAGRIRPTAGR